MPTINFKPTQKQDIAYKYLIDNVTTEVGFGGAANGGKSYLLSAWVVIMCLAFPGIGIGLGRKELTTLKKTTLVTLFKFLSESGLIGGVHYFYNQQLNIITFKNNSQIFLIDTAYQPSDPLYTRFGGLELTFVAIDESNETDYKAISILKTRIGRRLNDKYKLKPKLLETFNPDKGHIYQRYYKPFKDKTLPPYRQFIPSLAYDNPHCTQDYIEELMKADEITKQRLLFGNFDYSDSLNKLFDYDKILDLFTNSHVKEEEAKKYITADVAEFGADKIIIILWYGLVIKQILVKSKQSVEQTAKDIKELEQKYLVPRRNIIIDDDGLGKGVTTYLNGCIQFNNNRKALLEQNYQNLQTQCLYELAKHVNDNKIFITPNALDNDYKYNLIQDLDVNERKNVDKDGAKQAISKEEIKSIIGRSPDFRDALLMRMYYDIKPTTRINNDIIESSVNHYDNIRNKLGL